MTRHLGHPRRPNKTACNFSLSRLRPATEEEIRTLRPCSFCEPVAQRGGKR
jgi:hypothetical protein